MSDALTDINRDQRINDILIRIEKAEGAFGVNPDVAKAEELIELWKEYERMPSGYWSSSNEQLAYERIALYNLYIENGEIPTFPRLDYEDSKSSIDKVIRVGSGFIVNSLDEIILSKIRDKVGANINYRNFRVRIEIEEVEEISCSKCPCMVEGCEIGHCNSKNIDELKKRLDSAEEGKRLLG